MTANFFLRMVFNIHVFFYRLTNGSIGSRMGGVDVLLLTSKGRKTGKKRITPLSYMKEGSNYVIIASYGGSDNNPGWFYNLKSNKIISIQIKDKKQEVTAKVVSMDERNRLWPIITKWSKQYAKYQEKTTRTIPVVILTPKT